MSERRRLVSSGIGGDKLKLMAKIQGYWYMPGQLEAAERPEIGTFDAEPNPYGVRVDPVERPAAGPKPEEQIVDPRRFELDIEDDD
jgi:hypothetical protein